MVFSPHGMTLLCNVYLTAFFVYTLNVLHCLQQPSKLFVSVFIDLFNSITFSVDFFFFACLYIHKTCICTCICTNGTVTLTYIVNHIHNLIHILNILVWDDGCFSFQCTGLLIYTASLSYYHNFSTSFSIKYRKT